MFEWSFLMAKFTPELPEPDLLQFVPDWMGRGMAGNLIQPVKIFG